ncbi:MAG TPA: FAD binding domain-containing protein [Streptosporangiaceae bacterium]|nr:FAD binding domain-containing protein [Streptosporangiaceae bacterium]
MKPPPFDYHAPRTLGEALDALAEAGGDGKVLAGGQSLIPLLNMRLAAPGQLIDINRVAALDTLVREPGGIRVGALARHSRVERSSGHPLLRQALRHVAHPVIRNRGTVVGSLAHADPAAELPAVLAVLGGWVEVASVSGTRTIPAASFFAGPLESALLPGELAVSAFFPSLPPRSGSAFAELARRHGDYALAGVAAVVELDASGAVTSARIGCLGAAATPLVLDLTPYLTDVRPIPPAEGPYVARVSDAHLIKAFADAVAYVRERAEPDGDIHASAGYRRHLLGLLAARTLSEAHATASSPGPSAHRITGGTTDE